MENFVVFMEGVVFYTFEGMYPRIVNPLFDCVFLPRKFFFYNFTRLLLYYAFYIFF